MYRKASKGWAKHLDFMVLDILCLLAAFVVAYSLRHGNVRHMVETPLYRRMFLVLGFSWLFVTFFSSSFKNILKRGFYKEITATVKHVGLIVLIASFYLFIAQEGDAYSRLTMLFMGSIYTVLGYACRIIWKKCLRKWGVDGRNGRSLLILTSNAMVDTVVENIRSSQYRSFRVTGIALIDGDGSRTGTEVSGVKIVADRSTVLEYVCREWVDEVFVNLPKEIELPESLMNEFIQMGVTVHLKLLLMTELSGQKQAVERLGPYTVLTSSVNMASLKEVFYKRALDILGGIVGCLVTAVMFVCVAPMIYIQSPGPILFSQIRVGKNGKKFKLYKFRSMYLNAEAQKKELMEQNRVSDGMMFKMEHDPRIIGGDRGIGAFIRKTSIDEFPQFWNVLKGDMSLVGTRPPTVDEWEKYDLHHRVRLAIKPGITGMWQVSGRSQITDFEEVVKLDKEYITSWSFGLDLKILCKTVLVVVGRDGAV